MNKKVIISYLLRYVGFDQFFWKICMEENNINSDSDFLTRSYRIIFKILYYLYNNILYRYNRYSFWSPKNIFFFTNFDFKI